MRLFADFIFTLILVALTVPAIAFAASPSAVNVEVADVGKSKELVSALATKGITAVITPKNMRVVDEQNNCVVWIGKNVPLETIRVVLNEALPLYPHLQFYHVVGD